MFGHERRRLVPVPVREGVKDRIMLSIAFTQMGVAIVSSLVGDTLVTPAATDDFTHRQVAAVFGNGEVERLIQPSGRRLPVAAFHGFGVLQENKEISQDCLRNVAGAGSSRLGLNELAGAVNIDKPVLGTRTDGGTKVQALTDNAVRSKAREGLNHGSAAHSHLFREACALQLSSDGKFTSNNTQENPVVGLVSEGTTLRINDVLAKDHTKLRVAARIES